MIDSLDEIGWVNLSYAGDELPKTCAHSHHHHHADPDIHSYPPEPIYPDWKYKEYPRCIFIPADRVILMLMRASIGVNRPEHFYI